MNIDTIVGNYFFSLRTPARTAFFTLVTALGNVGVIAGLVAIVVLVLWYRNKKQLAAALIIELGIAEGITYVGKLLFHRARPLHALIVENDYSFPSGHATIAVAFYGFMAFLLLKQYTNKHARLAVVIVASVIILFIGISRLYLGVHYFTDIIAGYVVGTIGLLTGIYLS